MINNEKKGVVVAAADLTVSGCGESSSSSTGSDFQGSDSGQTTTREVPEFDEEPLVANLGDIV
ncbi:peptidase M75, partial [Pseudoalteromonas sp. S3785]